ncbi:MAG: BamA/TamA family outer membrane protein [Candidatus Aminicenantales bacterium]
MTPPHRILAIAVLLAAGLFPRGSAAEETAVKQDPYKARLIGLPFVFYTPETKLAFAAGSMLNFRTGRLKEEARTSSVWAFASYNLARQFSVLIKPEIYVKRNSLIFTGSLRFERAPQQFYGVGNDTLSADGESFTPRTFAVQVGVKRRVIGGLFGGLDFDVERTTMEKVEPRGLLASGAFAGSHGGMIAGFGASLDWDTRDSVLFPLHGALLELSADTYGTTAGSDFSFNRVELNLRKYWPLGTNRVLATQAYLVSIGGNVPFYKLALLGGESLLRGYYRGRFRDKGLALVQAEFRALITKRVGVAGFAGLADVFPGFRDVGAGRLKFAAGSGLRYVINKQDNATVRLDLAWGQGSFGLYITAREAF